MLYSKIKWYLNNLFNLCKAVARIFIYCLFHPKQFSKFLFPIFVAINDFYQSSHGELFSFEKTNTYQALRANRVIAQCNFFNSDPTVTRPVETQVLSSLVRHFQPKTIFEIGTYNGFTTLHLALNAPDDAKIYTLDVPENFDLQAKNQRLPQYSYDDYLVVDLSKRNIHQRMFHDTPCQYKITEIFADSMQFDFSAYTKKIDFIFIDGSHAYDYVRSDTQNALKILSPNGVIIWHDFDYIIHRDVFKFIKSLSKKLPIYSIAHTRFAIYSPRIHSL